MNRRIIFFGNERLVSGLDSTSAPILTGLIEKGYNVVAVISHHSDSKSRNQRPLEVAELAKKHNIPLFLPNKPSEISQEISDLKPDIAVLVAYGRIISQAIIDLFPMGIVNIHPSLLPKYRGPTPIESAILNGDSQTGVSIMRLSAGMDDGPVYAQKIIDLDNDTKMDLYEKITRVSTDLFFDIFPGILDGSITPTCQDDSQATYSKLIDKKDGLIDWKKPAEQIEHEIRAYAHWPQSKTTFAGIDVVICDARINPETTLPPGKLSYDKKQLLIGTATSALAIILLKPAGKNEMPVQAFLAGYRHALAN